MSRCTEYVPTAVETRMLHEEIPACHRHIVASAGNGGFWTLCGQWIPLRRLRILKVDRASRTMRVREEEQRIETWEWSDCHRTCALEHLLRKQNYRIGTGRWSWFWQPEAAKALSAEEVAVHGAELAAPVLTVAEAKHRLALLEPAIRAPHLPWWRRWLLRRVWRRQWTGRPA